MTEQKKVYAGFWLRLGAWIIDIIVLMGASFVLGLFLGIFLSIIALDVVALESEGV